MAKKKCYGKGDDDVAYSGTNNIAILRTNEIAITPPSIYFDEKTNLRSPPPIFRTLVYQTKARNCGASVMSVILSEFITCADEETNLQAISEGLITVNGKQTTPDYLLKNGDTVERLVHWHEPPVVIKGGKLEVKKLEIDIDGSGEKQEVRVKRKRTANPLNEKSLIDVDFWSYCRYIRAAFYL